MLCTKCGRWTRSKPVCPTCLQAERNQLRADFETDWLAVRLRTRVISGSWGESERIQRQYGRLDGETSNDHGDGRRVHSGHAISAELRERILSLLSETDSHGRPVRTYAEVGRMCDVSHLTARSIARAAGLRSRRAFV